MRVLLIRHGEAVDGRTVADPLRHLTERGRRSAKEVGHAILERGLRPGVLLCSPYVRAVQTAEILAAAFGYGSTIPVTDHLRPGATTARALALLEPYERGRLVVMVSHEPTLSGMARFLAGRPDLLAFRTAEARLLETDAGEPGRLVARLDPASLDWQEE
ncbi:MAG: phosphohistidine phosphatase SixA [Sandaracinaceae bacterium]